MKKVFLIHGWGGRYDGNWFPWLSLELRARGFEVSAPQMPNSDNPKLKDWLLFLKGYVGKIDKDTYFVGHSLGCIAIIRYLESIFGVKKNNKKIGGCVFVAGFGGASGISKIKEFYSDPINFSKVKEICAKFVFIFSDKDEYVTADDSLKFAREFGAKAILEKGKGHFRASEGVLSLHSALSAVLDMANRQK